MKFFLFFRHCNTHQRDTDSPQLSSQLAVYLQEYLLGYTLQLLLLGNCSYIDGLLKTKPLLTGKKTQKNVSSSNHDLVSSNSNHRQEHMTNSTNLGRNGTFDTAELLDGTIEIVSVTDHDAHYELHIRLCTDNLKLKWYGLNFILSFGQSRKLLLSL